ncbi:organic cation transporter protein [Magallana gigas]|uniref:organic cation transporter protein n=1 Tax=Magallana gigas TaxID=29159 RepID=UPI0033428798
MDVDEILRSLNKYGRYQMFQLVYNFFCLPILTYPVVIYVFIGYVPDFKCRVPTEYINKNYDPEGIQNVTVTQHQCDVIIESNRSGDVIQKTLPCNHGYEYFGPETTASEWNLVCGSESLGSMTTTVAVIGQLVGSGVFPSLADKYGRLVVTYTNAIALVICYILVAIVPWFSVFVILRFLLGAFGQGVGLSLATLALELFPAESRGFVVFLGSICWSLSICSISLVGFLLRHVSWRYTMLTAGLIGVHTLASRWILQESPRWLMANGRYDDVREWIKQAAKWNKKDISNILVDLDLVTARSELQVIVNTEHSDDENEAREKNSKETEEGARLVGDRTDSKDVQPGSLDKTLVQEESLSVLDIFRHRHILLTSLIVWIVWFVNGLTYYGLFLTSGTMTGNMYLNFFLNGVVEIPSIFFYMFTINRYGRKITCVIFHAIAGVCLCASAVLLYLGDSSVMEALALALSFAGKFGISGSFATIFLYTPEIYPTNLRAIGMGLASLASRIAAMISPYAGLLGTYIQWGPGVVFGTLSVLVTILFLWLPETTGKELPNTLEDVKHFYVIKQNKNKS